MEDRLRVNPREAHECLLEINEYSKRLMVLETGLFHKEIAEI